MITFRPGSIYLMLEILLCEAVFAWSCPKRKYFIPRLILSIGICVVFSYFFPFFENNPLGSFYGLLRVTLSLGYSFLAIWFCFDIKPFSILTIVASGDALQHIGYQTLTFLRYLPIEGDYQTFLYENSSLLEALFVLFAAVIGFLLFGIPYWKKKFYEKYDPKLSVIAFVTIFFCLIVSRLINLIPGQSETRSIASVYFSVSSCTLALIIEFTIYERVELSTKNALLSLLLKEEEKQFEESKQLMKVINQRGHDLKHLLQDFQGELPKEYVENFKKELDFYDNRYVTDNPSLDVVLSNVYYRYHKEGISVRFVGNTADLKFMDEIDMVMLFTNALDNAIEAVMKIDESKRNIQIIVEKKGNMVSLLFVNYFDGNLELSSDGLPKTSKENNEKYEHGIGLSSILGIAQKYGGNIDCYSEDDVFHLNIYLFKKDS